ncbi:transposase [Reinekea sp. G2M2-21]|uniref:transposase n=1 Tax=Reinekea sp. G2M2-21 TaxID=2788942 RepID=UPI0018A93389|nr:transposase [Reinekea sp. G2M2-21]
MGQTKKRKYDRYTLAFKLQAVKLANSAKVKSKDIAETLGIHPVMLYRWQMEHRNGELRENKHMKSTKPSPKRRPDRTDPVKALEDKLAAAELRIRKLEKALDNRTEELDLLKKAERFYAKK